MADLLEDLSNQISGGVVENTAQTTLRDSIIVDGNCHFVRQDTVVLLVDLVESVRLMQENEALTISRWAKFIRRANNEILHAFGGKMVKNLGDGFLAQFKTVPLAVRAAERMHSLIADLNAGRPVRQHFYLRAGLNAATAWSDGSDIFGSGVNLAARLATLANPGETIASAAAHGRLVTALATLAMPGETVGNGAARDQLVHGIDAVCEDLGECYLKHFEQPVRAYRIGPGHPGAVARSASASRASLEPTIAVIPFQARSGSGEHFDIGDHIADEIIWRLSRTANLKVISRLSTAVLRARADKVADANAFLSADYVLSGAYAVHGGRIALSSELSATRNNQVVCVERMSGDLADLFAPESEIAGALSRAVHLSIFDCEAKRILTQPLPTLQSYSLFLGCIELMHRSSRQEFLQTRRILEELINRHPRIAAPWAWLGKWYILKVTRGWSQDRDHDAAEALSATRAALDRDASDALALATEGFVCCHLSKDLSAAQRRCEDAVNANPSHSLGWLYRGTVAAFLGDGETAVTATRRAMELSPLDPQRYYYESLAATAELAAQRFDKAETLARGSIRLNRLHPSTWRALTIALVSQGKMDEARESLVQVLKLEPELTVKKYLGRLPNADLNIGREWARRLQEAGLPSGT